MTSKEMEKFMLEETWEEATRTPSIDELIREQEKMMHTKRPLFSLGLGTEGEMWITQEERENHLHIVGTTGEGKSKLLEHIMRYDIDKGNGFLFLDPSAGGKTAYDVLRYCAYKGRDKVIFIDPAHLFSHGKVIGLNPFLDHQSLEDACVTNVFDIVKIIFGTKDESETPMIAKYLPAILHVLYKAKATLYEALYFTDRDNLSYWSKRDAIFDCSHSHDRFRVSLEELFLNPYLYPEIRSTVRRLEPLFQDIIALSLAKTGLDFTKLVREKYIVLVNLSSFHLQPIHRRLLGTLLINELDFAVDRMRASGWKGVYYLYIDEVGQYATRKLADLLAYKRKNGLRVNLAHQYFNQFEDKYVLDAVTNLTKTKIAFYIPNPDDRMKVVKAFYGGDLADREVSYVLGQQKKQFAVVKKGKESAAIIKIPFVREVKADVEGYLTQIYQQPFYFSPKEIRDEINKRFPNTKRAYPVPAKQGAKPNNAAASKTNRSKTKHPTKSTGQAKEERASQVESNRSLDELFLEAEKLKGSK